MNRKEMGEAVVFPEGPNRIFDSLRNDILYSLELDGGRYADRRATWGIVDAIAQGVWVSSSAMRLYCPRFGLIHGWEESSPSADREGGEISAETIAKKDEVVIVRFSPKYLDNVARFISSGDKKPPYQCMPREVAIHEMRHFWQSLYLRPDFVRDTNVYAQEGLAAWSRTESEIDALSYAASLEQLILLRYPQLASIRA